MQHFFPRDVFPRSDKTSVPKLMQAQLLPQLARQPATTEQARAPQLETAQFHLQAVDRIWGNLAVVGKQTQVLILLLLFIKHRQRLAPGRLLLIIDLAEIENGSLHRLVRSDAMVFYDAEVAMIFCRLFCDCCCAETYPLQIARSSAMEMHDLTTKMMAKIPKIARNCESWVNLHTVACVSWTRVVSNWVCAYAMTTPFLQLHYL